MDRHIVKMEEAKNAFKILEGKPTRNRGSKCSWETVLKM